MKKLQITVAIALLMGLLFTAANVFASPANLEKPRQTPGAKATEKAIARATQAPGGGHANNGQGSQNTPGAKATDQAAKATERAAKHETTGVDKPKGQRLTYHGTVSAVGGDSLTLTLDGGGAQTFAVSSTTRIHIPTLGGSASLSSVNVGVQALVQVLKNDASYTALFIKVVPGKPQPVHRVGVVTAYTPGASITVMDKDGQSSTFLLTPDTKILPPDRASQLGVGSRVTIISRRDVTGGPLTAQGIVVHPQVSLATATGTESTATAAATETATSTPISTDTAEPTATATETATP